MIPPFVSLITPRTVPSVKFQGTERPEPKIRLNTSELSPEALEAKFKSRIEDYRQKGADLFEKSEAEAETNPEMSHKDFLKARRKFKKGRRLSITLAQSTGPSPYIYRLGWHDVNHRIAINAKRSNALKELIVKVYKQEGFAKDSLSQATEQNLPNKIDASEYQNHQRSTVLAAMLLDYKRRYCESPLRFFSRPRFPILDKLFPVNWEQKVLELVDATDPDDQYGIQQTARAVLPEFRTRMKAYRLGATEEDYKYDPIRRHKLPDTI